MTSGGQNSDHKSKLILKRAGLVIPFFLTIYGLMVLVGIVDGSPFASLSALLVLMLSWLVLAGMQIAFAPASYTDSLFRIGGYHLLAAGYILLISGLYSPLAALWLVLMLVAYIFGGVNGLKINIITLVVMFIAENVLRDTSDRLFSTTDPWLLLLVVLSGLLAIAIIKYHEVDQQTLIKSQRQEMIQRERTLTLVNNLADAVLSTDPDGVILVYNAAALSLLDTNDSLSGQKIGQIAEIKDQDGKPVSLESELKKAKSVTVRDDLSMMFDEDRVRLEVTISPIRRSFSGGKSQIDGYIFIMRDITKAKSVEEERDEFISVVSHELRTPITIAEGTISNAQLLLNRGEAKSETLAASIKAAHDQVMFLARMVNDLSTLSRAERGVLAETEMLDVKEFIYKIYNKYINEAEEKGLQFNIDTHGDLGKVSTSRLYLEELLQNFITNAIKYTHEGAVTFEVKNDGKNVCFAVRDSGIGISKSDQKKIFDKFYRAEDYRTRETSGTGLGLYVAAKLARRLGTTIELTSRLNHGSTFSFCLPCFNQKSTKQPISRYKK